MASASAASALPASARRRKTSWADATSPFLSKSRPRSIRAAASCGSIGFTAAALAPGLIFCLAGALAVSGLISCLVAALAIFGLISRLFVGGCSEFALAVHSNRIGRLSITFLLEKEEQSWHSSRRRSPVAHRRRRYQCRAKRVPNRLRPELRPRTVESHERGHAARGSRNSL